MVELSGGEASSCYIKFKTSERVKIVNYCTYSCPECDNRFTFVCYQEQHQHMLIHTGEKQYTCPKCSKRFLHRSNMKNYVLNHTVGKPHACLECDERLAQERETRNHMSNQSVVYPHACPECGEGF